jgi:hypothetical protein
MNQEFHFVDVNGVRYSHDRDPEICPLCHHAIHAQQETWHLVHWYKGPDPELEIVFRCPRATCQRLFIARYRAGLTEGRHTSGGLFSLAKVLPRVPRTPNLPPTIRTISPGFVLIYTEAGAAEADDLKQIAGVGYRKALEFLIKDYCVHTRPSSEEEIKQSFLGTCINNFVDDPRVKECARRAAWLGNDETHYLRRWADKDMNDLKLLIELTIAWIQSAELTKQYLADMPAGES